MRAVLCGLAIQFLLITCPCALAEHDVTANDGRAGSYAAPSAGCAYGPGPCSVRDAGTCFVPMGASPAFVYTAPPSVPGANAKAATPPPSASKSDQSAELSPEESRTEPASVRSKDGASQPPSPSGSSAGAAPNSRAARTEPSDSSNLERGKTEAKTNLEDKMAALVSSRCTGCHEKKNSDDIANLFTGKTAMPDDMNSVLTSLSSSDRALLREWALAHSH